MSIGGTSFSPNLTNLPKGTQISGEDLEGYFKKIVAQTVTANNYELSVNGNVYKFGMRYVMTGISEVINSGGKITIKYTIRPALTNLSIDEGHSEKSSG